MERNNVIMLEKSLIRGKVIIKDELYENVLIKAYLCGFSGTLILRRITFKNCEFIRYSPGSSSFFDCMIFDDCIFENCKFDEVDVRWSQFKKCKFKDCTGTFNWVYGVGFYNNCTYENTHIDILNPDNGFRHYNSYKGKRKAPRYIGE